VGLLVQIVDKLAIIDGVLNIGNRKYVLDKIKGIGPIKRFNSHYNRIRFQYGIFYNVYQPTIREKNKEIMPLIDHRRILIDCLEIKRTGDGIGNIRLKKRMSWFHKTGVIDPFLFAANYSIGHDLKQFVENAYSGVPTHYYIFSDI
jgi:hypothetical protein